MEWITFQGKKVSTETADHQHLSNVIWFMRIVLGFESTIKYEPFMKAIADRFNGQLLPYRPHIEFNIEIKFLQSMGVLVGDDKKGWKIVWEGEQIGEILPFTMIKL